MFFDIALLAYLIDKYFGEFPIKHMMVWMGEFIQAHRDFFAIDVQINNFTKKPQRFPKPLRFGCKYFSENL